MICTGWALQALDAYPGLWSKAGAEADATKLRVPHLEGESALDEKEVRKRLMRELSGGLRTWKAIFEAYGYIPTGIGCQTAISGVKWDSFSDTGGYAHLISAASQWIFCLEGKQDWKVHRLPSPK